MRKNDRNIRKSFNVDKKKPEEAKKASSSLAGKEETTNINAGHQQGVDAYFESALAGGFEEEKNEGFTQDFEACLDRVVFYDEDDCCDDVDGGRF